MKSAAMVAAAISATGPANMTPSIPNMAGNSNSKGSRKMIYLVREIKIPRLALPMAVKKFAVSGWMQLIKVKKK